MIPEGVTHIGQQAFSGCESLTEITIPASVKDLGEGAFIWCPTLTKILVPWENSAYLSADGVLFSKDGSRLICLPAGRPRTTFTVPSSVTEIAESAAHDCRNLTSVGIPSSVTEIGLFAFWACDSLTDVYFGGTEEEWNAITIGEYNDLLLNATIHYNTADAYFPA